MSSIKKFAWSGAAVVLAAILMLGIMVPSASAAVTVTAGTTAISTSTNSTTGTGAYTAIANITFTESADDQLLAGNTIIINMPAGWRLQDAGASSSADFTTAINGTGTVLTLSYAADLIAGAQTIVISSLEARPATETAVGSNLTIDATSTALANPLVTAGGIAAGQVVGTITTLVGAPSTITATIVANATACGTTNPVSTAGVPLNASLIPTLPADGGTGFSLCANVRDAAGAPVSGVPVTFTVSVGYVSTGTGKSVIAFTNAAGNATTTYRGAGNQQTTDTAVASLPALNKVATPLSIQLTVPQGTSASKIVINTPTTIGLGANTTNVSPGYSSPTSATNVSLQVTDSSGLGIGGSSVQVTVDRGGLVENRGFAATTPAQLQALCTTTPARSIILVTGDGSATGLAPVALTASSVGSTSYNALTVGGTVTPGAGDFIVCTNQTDAPGKITVTAQNITTTMPNATLTLAQAGRPAKINIRIDGSTVTATVVDAAGNPVADGTPVSFTISQNVGAVSTGCSNTTNGAATSVAALTGATGNVLVSTTWNETGTTPTASTCPGIVGAIAGSQSLAVNVSLPSGTTTGPGTGVIVPSGPGTISPPIPSTGFGLTVFSGGTTAQLVTASKCPPATAAFFATNAGGFLTFVPGTTIAPVNADFLAFFTGGNIPANTALIGKCA